ncbi:MAG TPA: divergent polysaccharide deacetylase family protein [Thermodesulfobacteriota bacterium]|nr:divergent polysaccharide deacetylase family protein [Thermodesulfobacteriota bacterium]
MKRRQREYTHVAIKNIRRARRQKNTRRLFIVLAYVFFLTLCSSLFFYVKNKVSEENPEQTSSPSNLTEGTEEVDAFIQSALFNLGLSIKDVKSAKLYHKIKDGVEWEFRDTRVTVPPEVTQEKIERTLKYALSKTEADFKFQKGQNSLTSEVEIYGFPTHKIRFDFYKELEKRPEKVAKNMKSFPLREALKSKDRSGPPQLGSREKGLEKKFKKVPKDIKASASKEWTGLKDQGKLPEHYRSGAELVRKGERLAKLTKPSFLEWGINPREEEVQPEVKGIGKELEKPILNSGKPRVVIIVDDLGLNKVLIDKLLEIPAKLNFAILPNLPYSDYAAEKAYRKGWDVILHLPMEPKVSSGYTALDAGDGVLFVGLSREEILAKLDSNLASIPYIKGVNNHMGSKFTENGELMELVLQRLKSRGLFFIDSKTSKDTAGFLTAKKLGMRTAERDIFLDQTFGGPNYIRSQIEKLVNISKIKGYAIGICHPYPVTIEVLSEMVPRIEKEVDLVTISSVVN